MESQHPIPQQIASYKFKLVGDMTLPQFLKLAGGISVALIFYATGIPGIIKWPLMLISAGIGAAMAFVPLGGRPLEKWIIAFLRSIYTPTSYVWVPGTAGSYFKGEGLVPAVAPATPLTPQSPQSQPTIAVAQQAPAMPGQPARVISETVQQQVAPTPAQSKVAPVIEIPEEEIVETTSSNKLETAEKSYLARITQSFTLPSISKFTRQQTASKPEVQSVVIPNSQFVTVAPANAPAPKVEKPTVPLENLPKVTNKVEPIIGRETTLASSQAQFSAAAAPPVPSERPNVIVGQVMDAEGHIVDSAILEITDDAGRPLRAFKSNKLGHFTIATPLASGQYHLTAEKDGLTFEPLNFEAKGEIIQPIAIRAKGGTV